MKIAFTTRWHLRIEFGGFCGFVGVFFLWGCFLGGRGLFVCFLFVLNVLKHSDENCLTRPNGLLT